MSKKILIDMRHINERNGFAAYLKMIVKAVSDCNYDIFFLVNDDGFDFSPYYTESKNIKLIYAKSKPYSFWQNVEIPLIVRKNKIDILHWTNFDIPVFFRLFCPKSVLLSTIHDLIPINYSDKYKRNIFKFLYFKLMFEFCAKISDEIISVSEFSRQEAISVLKINPDIIHTVHCSYKGKLSAEKGVRPKPNSNYKLFFIGNNFPHKNIEVVIDAVKILKDKNICVEFNIAGMETVYTNFLKQKINDCNIGDRVKILGKIPDSEVERLYKESDIFVFPSLVEGFGSPLIESMNFGLPIISSNRTVMPEVIEDAGILTNPDAEGFAKGIEQIINDDNLRVDLIKKGYKRLEHFSDENFKSGILEVYNKL